MNSLRICYFTMRTSLALARERKDVEVAYTQKTKNDCYLFVIDVFFFEKLLDYFIKYTYFSNLHLRT